MSGEIPNEWASLSHVDEVDGMLGEKLGQLRDAKSGTERHDIKGQIDELLERRHALGGIALEASDANG